MMTSFLLVPMKSGKGNLPVLYHLMRVNLNQVKTFEANVKSWADKTANIFCSKSESFS